MPTFDTPGPISATLDVIGGDVRISASDRADTIVDGASRATPSNDEDRKAAEQTRVEFADGQLLVKAPKLRSWLPQSTGGSIDVDRRAARRLARPRRRRRWPTSPATGPLGECRLKTSLGHIRARAGRHR